MERLDVRDISPAERHETIHETFEALDSGETLVICNDHDPKPLYHEFRAEIETFDADGYRVTKQADDRFVAELPKR
jgi:uncharacterized protein (DUF2249 family)